MRWVQERVHGWGKEALHTVGLHISVSPWAFSPDTAFSHSVVWSPLRGFSQPPFPWLVHSSWAQRLGGPPPPPPPILFDWRKEKAEKCSKGLWPRKAQCERWWWRRGCDAYLPLTHTAVIAQHFTIWRSIQQPGEDVSLTRHLDRTDKHWGWTDLPLTLSMNIPFSYGQITPWFVVTP